MPELDTELERTITGKAWIECESCAAKGRPKRILATTQPPMCQDHGGPATNCRTCGTGSRWWYGNKCLNCGGDGTVAGSGAPDHEVRARQRMVRQFGPRLDGDALLLGGDEQRGRDEYLAYLEAHPDHEVARWWARTAKP